MKNPVRKAFGVDEQNAISKVVKHYAKSSEDIPYFGKFEKKLIQNFTTYQGGGYAKAVSTGTASAFVSLQALNLKKNSEIIISPFVDAGVLNSMIFLGLKAVICDTEKNSYNISLDQIKKKITKKTKAVFLVHSAGEVVRDIINITNFLYKSKIFLIEDTSQCPGGSINGRKVGTFGDICCLSTMYRKSLYGGSSGGIVFTKKKKYYKEILACSDRGKKLWDKKYNFRDPSSHLFPALNWNTNEFSCAIAIESLKRLNKTIKFRFNFYKTLKELINKNSEYLEIYDFKSNDSIFFIPIYFRSNIKTINKIKFAKKLQKNGVGLNEHYKFLMTDWKWAKKYVHNKNIINAINFRNKSFNLFVNEKYDNVTASNIIKQILKIERKYV